MGQPDVRIAVLDIQDAISLLDQSEPRQAARLLERLIDELPAYAAAHILLARSYEALEDWDSALGSWRKVNQIIPNSPVIQNGLERSVARLTSQRRHAPAEPEPDYGDESAPELETTDQDVSGKGGDSAGEWFLRGEVEDAGGEWSGGEDPGHEDVRGDRSFQGGDVREDWSGSHGDVREDWRDRNEDLQANGPGLGDEDGKDWQGRLEDLREDWRSREEDAAPHIEVESPDTSSQGASGSAEGLDKAGWDTPEADAEWDTPEAEVGWDTPEAEAELDTPEAGFGWDTPEAEAELDTPEADVEWDAPEAEAEWDAPEAEIQWDTPEADADWNTSEDEADVPPSEAAAPERRKIIWPAPTPPPEPPEPLLAQDVSPPTHHPPDPEDVPLEFDSGDREQPEEPDVFQELHDAPEAETPRYEDLDRLINELESARIVPRPDFESLPAPDLDDDIEDVVSETLARIYASQGQYDEAARVYELLAGQHPEDAEEYLQKASEMRSRASDGL